MDKLRSMDEGVYFQTHAHAPKTFKPEWISATYDDFRRAVDSCASSPYYHNPRYQAEKASP